MPATLQRPIDLDLEREVLAVKRVLSRAVNYQLKRGLSRSQLAKKMATSRPAIDRLLDARNTSITLRTFVESAKHAGFRVKLTLEPRIDSIRRVRAPKSSAKLMKRLGEALDGLPPATR